MANVLPTREIVVAPAEQSVEQPTSVQIPDTTTREALQAQQRYYQLRLTILGGVTIAFLVWAVVVTVLLAQATQKSCEYPTPTPPPARVDVPLRCQLRNIQVSMLKNATGTSANVSVQQIQLQIGTPEFAHPGNRHWSCIDGRHENEVLMTPGGDAAEFITALATHISFSSTPQDFSPQRVKAMWHPLLVQQYNKVKRFYMHTDEHAELRLGTSLNITQFDILEPAEGQKERLLDSVANPSFLGCGHLRLMAQNPGVYGVPSTLFTNFMRIYHRTLWGMEGADLQGRVRMDVLPGDHDENAVIVMLESGCPGFAPVVAARRDMPHLFVADNVAVLTLRKDLIAFFNRESAAKSTNLTSIEDAVTAVGSKQLVFTVNALASSLPMFSVLMEGILVADGD